MVKIRCQGFDEAPPQAQCEDNLLPLELKETTTKQPAAPCWDELFAAQAAQTPEAVAAVCGDKSFTYGELNERANRLAHHLRAMGVGPETLVGLCVGRSLDLLVGLIGIIKAGGAYVPLPPDHPPERLAHILQDSGMPVVVTQQHLEHKLLAAQKTTATVCLDRDAEAIAQQSGGNPGPGARPDQLIYVIYTSGSTGAPKGVAVEHRAVASHCLGFARYFGLTPADRVLQFAPLSFDVSVEEIFPTLLTGGRVVLRPESAMAFIVEFHAFIAEQQITVVNLPTSFWNEWMKEVERQGREMPPSLRIVIAGSETVTIKHLARWRKLAGKGIRWCNAYGTTEATITSTIYEPEAEELPAIVPIGRPEANTRVYLLDSQGQLVPDGEPGEVYVGGDKIARGYLNQPELTALHFVPDPFNPRAGARMNRTGDWARRRPDGNLEFLGRNDAQVNLRGFRVELGEIEAALLAIPEVAEAVVVARSDAGSEKRLVAYVVLAESEAKSASELRQLLKQKLPHYMIPAAFVRLAELPRQLNGKLDRQALPAPGSARPELEQTLVNPADALQEKLAAIWRDVLSLDSVGIEDDFFDLGGHSLQAARVVRAASALTGRKMPPRMLYESPTIRRFAERIRQEPPAPLPSSLVAIQPQGSKPPLYLVHGAGGGMLWGYANLARHLGASQPLYCFHSRGLDGLEEFARVEDMAGQYVADLLAFQPKGPFYLGGYCFGGEVAFEMAQQLQAQGQRVELLMLFNAMPPNSRFEKPRLTPAFIIHFLANSWQWLSYFFRWSPQARQSFVRRKVRWLKNGLRRAFRPADGPSGRGAAAGEFDLSAYPENRRDLWDIHLRASSQYQPRTYAGNAVVFRTPIYPFFCSFDPTFGWNEFINGALTVKVIPGAHESILDEPHVGELARELKNCLGGKKPPLAWPVSAEPGASCLLGARDQAA